MSGGIRQARCAFHQQRTEVKDFPASFVGTVGPADMKNQAQPGPGPLNEGQPQPSAAFVQAAGALLRFEPVFRFVDDHVLPVHLEDRVAVRGQAKLVLPGPGGRPPSMAGYPQAEVVQGTVDGHLNFLGHAVPFARLPNPCPVLKI